MTNENIEKMLKELECSVYKLNTDNGIIEKSNNGGGGSTAGVKEIVNITTFLTDNKKRFIIIGDGDIQIEH